MEIQNSILVNNISKNRLTAKFLALTIAVFVFLSWFSPGNTLYWGVTLAFMDIIYIFFHPKVKITLNSRTLAMFFFVMLLFIGAFVGSNILDGIKYVFSLFLFFFNYLLLLDNEEWLESFIFFLKVICLFFIIGSIIQIISPSFISSVNSYFLNSEQLQTAQGFLSNNTLTLIGFTHQPGRNGFILSVALSLTLAKGLSQQKYRGIYSIMYFVIFYFIFLTRKRGFILFNIIILFYLLIIGTKNKVKVIIPLIGSSAIFTYFLFKTEAGLNLLLKFVTQEDITSGRFYMNQVMVKEFLEAPVLGQGTYTTVDLFTIGYGHNIYLQVLSENGIFAFLLFCLILGVNFYKTYKIFNNINILSREGEYLILSISLQLLFILWGFTGNPLYDVFALIIYVIAIAISYHLEHKMKSGDTNIV